MYKIEIEIYEGKGGEFVDSEANTYGGKIVVNPSGGLISKGHPLGATGLAQCAEMVWQLRGLAEKRQVEGASTALAFLKTIDPGPGFAMTNFVPVDSCPSR